MAIAKTRQLSADDSASPPEAVKVQPSGIIDEVPSHVDLHSYFQDAAFMEELVTIMLHPMLDGSETGVPVGVNGVRVYLVPGKVQRVPRKHVAQLMKARPDIVHHYSGEYGAPEAEHNKLFRQSTSRYNFDIVEDTPKGIAWAKQLRATYQRR